MQGAELACEVLDVLFGNVVAEFDGGVGFFAGGGFSACFFFGLGEVDAVFEEGISESGLIWSVFGSFCGFSGGGETFVFV